MLAASLILAGAMAAVGWRGPDTVEAGKVLLTDDIGTPVIVLRGELGTPTPALVLETPGGVHVLTLGPSVRPAR